MGVRGLTVSPTVLGIASLVLGLGALSSQDVAFKILLADRYSVLELLCLRSLIALVIFRVTISMLGVANPLVTNRLGGQLLRGTLLFAALTCYYVALASMPLLDVAALFLTAPLIATLLAALILKERAGLRRWMATGVGFCGAMVMLRPDAGALPPSAGFGIAAAFFYAASIVCARYLGGSDSAVSTAYYSMLAYVAWSGVGMLIVEALGLASPANDGVLTLPWTDPDLYALLWLCGSGLAVSVGFFCQAQAYRLAPVATLAPFEYVTIVWGGLIGFFVFQEIPTLGTAVGVTLIVGSGVYVALQFGRES